MPVIIGFVSPIYIYMLLRSAQSYPTSLFSFLYFSMSAKANLMRTYKIIIVGGGGVGKSAVTIRFIQSRFVEDWDPTIEDSYTTQRVIDSEVALLDILDTAGQDDYRAMRDHYMRNGEGFLLMYNINSRSSFEEIFDFHENILRAKDSSQVPVVIVGNKCDLEFQREVTRNEGRETAERLGCRFIETSAKMSINVDEAFATIVREIRRFNKGQQASRPTRSLSTRSAARVPEGYDVETDKCYHGCGGCVIL